jgi:hypothetical protein
MALGAYNSRDSTDRLPSTGQLPDLSKQQDKQFAVDGSAPGELIGVGGGKRAISWLYLAYLVSISSFSSISNRGVY